MNYKLQCIARTKTKLIKIETENTEIKVQRWMVKSYRTGLFAVVFMSVDIN